MSSSAHSESAMICPLCELQAGRCYEVIQERRYLQCENCLLIWLVPAFRLSADEERSRYALHRNDPFDTSYREHLSKAIAPLLKVLAKGARGLDFGCGPGPTASLMLEEAGFEMRNYDPFFVPDEAALKEVYDFIVCTEVAEHFFTPHKEFGLLSDMTASRGWLALMTQLLEPDQPFSEWWYARDPTHVAFYQRESLQWISENWGWEIVRSSEGVHLFRKLS